MFHKGLNKDAALIAVCFGTVIAITIQFLCLWKVHFQWGLLLRQVLCCPL